MSSNNAAMEAALLAIAKDLLKASDDLASSDPSASAKLAHEAYEIGRDLGIVRNHLDDADDLSSVSAASAHDDEISTFSPLDPKTEKVSVRDTAYQHRVTEDESDADLFRILDRQKAMLPTPSVEATPMRKPSQTTRSLTFESVPSRRSGLFGWMRPREWRHAG